MVDVPQTSDVLLNEMQDNTSGRITPQVMRNFVVSNRPTHAYMYMTVGTVFGVVNTNYVVLGGTTALDTGAVDFTMPQNFRLTYGGTVVKNFYVSMAFTYEGSTILEDYNFGIGKNGNILTPTILPHQYGILGRIYPVTVAAIISLSPGDFIEPLVQGSTGLTSMTSKGCLFSVFGLFT